MASSISRLLLAYTIAAIAPAVVGQSRVLERACDGVQKEVRDKIRAKAESLATPEAKLAPSSKAVREWVLTEGLGVPEKCTVELVRAVFSARDEAEKQKAKAVADAASQRAWDGLSIPEKRWMVYRSLNPQEQLNCDIQPGVMGKLNLPITVISVVSTSKAIVSIDCGCTDPLVVALRGIDTSSLITDGRYMPPSGVFWCPRTGTYRTVLGGSRTVYVLDRLPIDPETNGLTPPPSAKLDDFLVNELPSEPAQAP